MKKKQKLTLEALTVHSFETSVNAKEQQLILAGQAATLGPLCPVTNVCSVSLCLESPCNITRFGCGLD